MSTGSLRRAVDAVLGVPLALKIVAASAAFSGLAFGLGLTGATIVRRTALQGDSTTLALMMGLAWIIIAALLSAGIVRIALAPLRNLEGVAALVERGDLTPRAASSRLADRDIARLTHTFNLALDQQASSRERLRELARRSLQAEEDINRRIAVELREGPGQRLASLLLRLQQADRGGPSALGAIVEEARGEIATALEIVRRHSGDRIERLLDDLGLAGAVAWQARQIAREHDLHVKVDVGPVDRFLPRQARVALVLFVREALENVGRHAAASAASVSVRCVRDRVVVAIVDDGRGFDPQDGAAGGLGLLCMEETVAAVGGTLKVARAAPRGTHVSAWIPARTWSPSSREAGPLTPSGRP